MIRATSNLRDIFQETSARNDSAVVRDACPTAFGTAWVVDPFLDSAIIVQNIGTFRPIEWMHPTHIFDIFES